jgi:hypothetical protein
LRLDAAAVVVVTLLAGAGCDGDEPDRAEPDRAEPVPARVAVPEHDASPPEAEITLRGPAGAPLASASQPPAPSHPDPVKLPEPRLRGAAVGRDADGGVARVRVSIKELISCRHPGGGSYERLRTRYFPPSQIERIRSNPGALLPTSASRSIPLALAGDRCAEGTPIAVRGELWGEAINGSGLEAVTPHLRFGWSR